MYYKPPENWTEELFDRLNFDEDDRYEWKSGFQLISGKDTVGFSNKLAKEIGALANSFGGTLFVGIDDQKQKVGIPAIFCKGKTIAWLESIIPTLLELRLQHFRVSNIALSDKTQELIGIGNVIIAIDVFDSELAPHQCKFDHKYYYRVNSKSDPAPHHYLAFLWDRTNANMSQVASWWFRGFMDPLIDIVEAAYLSFVRNS